MFTLKLYRNGPIAPGGHTVILETVGLWINCCDGDVKHILAFKKKVGVQDEDGTPEFYVGGSIDQPPPNTANTSGPPVSAINDSNYYSWGVLENAMGKTTEMLR